LTQVLNKLSRRSRRILALLILIALLVVATGFTVVPLRAAFVSYDESIADLEFRLKKYREMARQEIPLKEQLDNLTSQQAAAEGLLKGESQAIAGANLQALFKQIVQNAGGRLESTQVLPGAAAGVMESISIRAQFSGNIEMLQRVLHGIEFNNSILFVDRIEVRAKRIRRSRRSSKVATPGEVLSVSMEVSGYRRNGEQG